MVENFLAVLRDHTAGDPMRENVKWTNLSRRQISRKLKELGTPAGKNVVSRLLHEHGYRRRKPQKKRTMGQHADRNAQFEKIAKLKQEYLDFGKPVTQSSLPSSTITISPAAATAKSSHTESTTSARTKRRCI